ncbi:MAG TPA: RNase adapter RapZ [Caldisericia bacterium]|nr:MAG: glmZ(sRNA)-inactivating NTPase [bacterium ADurb.Bin132]HNW32115.1 RNase adapter RapZ [Caldisericia bacterium]HOC80140.1 RNase adapter RapZ [Caldisericia bacterium]HOG71043.1 RNase adapter RapZ [Caldisericia bacterium]HPA66359.1 RNase adapter RapZ [Caldisericia bacterium]
MNRTLIIVCGLSGAGKSRSLAAFEDIGYFTVENLPLELLSKFVSLGIDAKDNMEHMAVTLRLPEEENYIDTLKEQMDTISASGVDVGVLYLEANTDTLIRRYQETRRKHPLLNSDTNGSIFDAIQRERLLLRSLKKIATQIIDTSALTPQDLKVRISKIYTIKSGKANLTITFLSFGFRYGVPSEADLVMDVRFINNPYYDESLRELDGTNVKIANFVLSDESAQNFLLEFTNLLKFLLPQYLAKEGKSHLTVAFGCTGGKHRSVVIASEMANRLKQEGYDVTVVHRDKDKQ